MASKVAAKIPMATTMAARFGARRMSSSGKILSEEEKAAENVYIRKTEREKLARKAAKPEDKPTAGAGEPITDAKPSASSSTGNQ